MHYRAASMTIHIPRNSVGHCNDLCSSCMQISDNAHAISLEHLGRLCMLYNTNYAIMAAMQHAG